jgi:hypothetical protein
MLLMVKIMEFLEGKFSNISNYKWLSMIIYNHLSKKIERLNILEILLNWILSSDLFHKETNF